jgi:hypothetical protein
MAVDGGVLMTGGGGLHRLLACVMFLKFSLVWGSFFSCISTFPQYFDSDNKNIRSAIALIAHEIFP